MQALSQDVDFRYWMCNKVKVFKDYSKKDKELASIEWSYQKTNKKQLKTLVQYLVI